MTSTRVDELVLHTVDDVLYFGTGSGRQHTSVYNHGPEEFVQQEWVRQADSVKLLGTLYNAPLIVALHNQRLKQGAPQVRLGSPSLCRLEREPPDVIRQLLEIEHPPSVGGWHAMTGHDYTTYALAKELLRKGKPTDVARQLYRAHPAYHALQFIPTIQPDAAMWLICQMLDPRFNVDPDNPDATGRLKQFFGLGEPGGVDNVKRYMSGSGDCTARYAQAEAVLDTWAADWESVIAQDAVEPRHFLMRVVKRVTAKREAAIGLLRASHVFLRFVRQTWLENLTPPRRYQNRQRRLGRRGRRSNVQVVSLLRSKQYSPTLFVPRHFFANQDETDAWYAYIRGK